MEAGWSDLAEALSEIRRRFPELAVQAIPWIRLKHPIHPVQTELCEAPDALTRSGLSVFLLVPGRFARCLLSAAHMGLQLSLLHLRLRRVRAALRRKPFKLIAKTWAFGDTLLPGPRDFYYGDLQQRLAGEGVGMLLLTGKPSEMRWSDFGRAGGSASEPCQLPELCLAPATAPLRSAMGQWVAGLRLLREAGRTQDPFMRRVLLRASADAFLPATTAISLYDWIGREAVRCWRPTAVLALYEGYPWEYCFWRGAKGEDPSCKTVGYQHTILLRHNLALLRAEEGERPRLQPDVVLCLGPRTQALLRPSHTGSELLSFGTFRELPSRAGRRQPRPEGRTVLVLPEGYVEEAVLLFNVALQTARRLPEYRFVLRSHPVLPFEEVLPRLAGDPAQLRNVRVSRAAPIEADFAEASVLLYRGSSSVLYGILHGLKAVYFSNGRFPEPDPLFEVDAWRERVSSAEELEDLLRRYARTGAPEAAEQWAPAADYVGSYTVPAREDSIEQLREALEPPSESPVAALGSNASRARSEEEGVS